MQTQGPLTRTFPNFANWLIFFTICFIWGSSFILMKLGLYDKTGHPLLTYTQVAAIRIFSAGIVLSPVVIRNFKKVPPKFYALLLLSGFLGSLVPAFLFCLAETEIDSALAGTLNSLTPLFAVLLSYVVFKQRIAKLQVYGIIIGFGGIVLLFLVGRYADHGHAAYGLLVILATFAYALNIILVNHALKDLSAMVITAFSIFFVAVPSAVILWLTGFYALPLHQPAYQRACAAICSLGVLSTAIAWLLFYSLVKRTGILFTSTASYGIPFIAFGWGWIYGESVTWAQFGSLFLVLAGVCLTRVEFKACRKRSTSSPDLPKEPTVEKHPSPKSCSA